MRILSLAFLSLVSASAFAQLPSLKGECEVTTALNGADHSEQKKVPIVIDRTVPHQELATLGKTKITLEYGDSGAAGPMDVIAIAATDGVTAVTTMQFLTGVDPIRLVLTGKTAEGSWWIGCGTCDDRMHFVRCEN